MAQLFGLLVGVSRYHPMSRVPNLTGCENDVRRISDYIFKTFPSTPPENIKCLLSEAATRAAVTEAFISHLCDNKNIGAGDTVLFYYSGHGSTAPSARPFRDLKLDSAGKDETLVLYDSRLAEGSDLRDKELALLLSKINPAANIVVIADSCHSGSITRGIDDIRLGLPKFISGDIREKALEEYLTIHGEGYADMSPLGIPGSVHLSLSACDRGEVAYETSEAGGLFTSTLLSLLEESRERNSYAQVYEQLYTELKRLSDRQTPQIFVSGGFNSGKLFLTDERGNGRPDYRAVYANGSWTINYGALHGLDTDRRRLGNYQISLYLNREDKEAWANCSIATPGLEQSILDLQKLPPPNYFVLYADINNKQPSLLVSVAGKELYDLCMQSEERLPSIVLAMEPAAAADYWLVQEGDDLVIKDYKTRELVHGVSGTGQGGIDQASVDQVLKALAKIEKWHRLYRLENKTRDFPEGDIEWKLSYDAPTGPVVCDTHAVTLDISEDQPKIPYGFILNNKSSEPYFVALLHLASNYAVTRYTPPVDSSVLRAGVDDPLGMVPRKKRFVLNKDQNEDIDIFKLIISRDQFSDYFLEQTGLRRAIVGRTRGVEENRGSEDITENWFVKTITVRTVRQGQRISPAQKVETGFVSIAAHASFQANVTLTPMTTGTKDLNPIAALRQLFEDKEYEIINLDNSTRSVDGDADRSVIELTGIDKEQDLREDPLTIELNYALKEEEQAVAVTYDGEFVYVLDLLRPADDSGKQLCTIRNMPGIDYDPRRTAAKSPLRAFWFCFLKLVVKKEDEVFKLRSIVYEKGKVVYEDEDMVGKRVAAAGKILLLVHGIIGNTKSIAQSMEYLLIEKTYDLIITFDYENLNTPIETIARKLRERLVAAGISEQRKTDLLVHSMGGLICRYMIEKENGAALVSRMIMAGTPNGGSVFGKLPGMRDWLTGIIGFGLNFGMKFLGHWGPVIKMANSLLKKTDVVTHTLAEMDGNSDFIKMLNDSKTPVSTTYFIVAGDSGNYSTEKDGFIKKFIEKSELLIGHLAYGKEPNDIAVSVKNIRSVPEGFCKDENIHEIGCHHLNYFEADASLEALKKIFRS